MKWEAGNIMKIGGGGTEASPTTQAHAYQPSAVVEVHAMTVSLIAGCAPPDQLSTLLSVLLCIRYCYRLL